MGHHLSMRRPGLGCAPFVVLLALLLPAHAVAATANVFSDPPVVHYEGDEGVDDVVVTVDETPKWIFKNGGFPGSALIKAGSTCTDVNADEREIACAITGIARLDLGGGDDLFLGGDDEHGVTVKAGGGNDQLIVCCGGDNVLEGGTGADEFKLGGATGESTIELAPAMTPSSNLPARI